MSSVHLTQKKSLTYEGVWVSQGNSPLQLGMVIYDIALGSVCALKGGLRIK